VLIVRRFGYGGAFWNIGQAVDSASEGDTVYVDMRGETSYWGNPVIRKNVTLSISDTSLYLPYLNIEASSFKLNHLKMEGVSYNGNEIEINHCNIRWSVYINRGNCSMNNSSVYQFNAEIDTTSEIKLYNSEIIDPYGSGGCFIKADKIFVCGIKLGSNTIINGKEVTFNGNKSLKNYNTNRIYCDKINFFGNDLINGNLIISANYGIVSNNKITNEIPVNYNSQYSYYLKSCITERDYLSNEPLIIANNYLGISSYYCCGNSGSYSDSVFILKSQMMSSNLINFTTNAYGSVYTPSFQLKHCLINLSGGWNFDSFTNQFSIDSSNQFFTQNFSSFVLDSQYRLAFDTTLVTNRGFDDPAFSDLDLSRNDIGPLGGPTPITNYQNTGGAPKPQIWDVTLPRRTFYPSGPIPIKAVGTAK
jgi:hypothetical protein